MAFSSQLYPGEVIFNDDTPESAASIPEGMGAGLELELHSPAEYGSLADPFPSELLIPRSEWQDRIKEQEERKTRLSDFVDLRNIPCKNQSSTNYCWINAPVHALEIVRARQNQEYVPLSPASAGAQIKGFRNVGGWGKEGLEWIVKNGVVPSSMWPDNAIDRRYLTQEAKQVAMDYRVTEWWLLQPRNLDQHISLLLRGIPAPVGLLWWRHEVTDYEAVWVDGQIGVRFRNSWGMGWGTRGYGIRTGSKLLADDIVAPRVAIAA